MPQPGRAMSLAEWDALGEAEVRYELVAGVLVMAAPPLRRHGLAMVRLGGQIDAQVPDGWAVGAECEVLVQAAEPVTVRVPDLVVVRADAPQQRAPACDVALVVEILSPSTRTIDLRDKAFEYAEAGIPYYWVVDPEPPMPAITVFGLGAPGDGYMESPTAARELVVAEPFPLRIDIDGLVGRRR